MGTVPLGKLYPGQGHVPSARWLVACLPESEPSLRFTASSLILEAAAAGAALAGLPTFISDDDPRLVRFSETLADLAYDLWMITHANARRLHRVRWTMDRLSEIFQSTWLGAS